MPRSYSFTRTQQVVCGEYTRQMPSCTPDSRTISATSSVMSVTCSPPVVVNVRSAWNTFIGGEFNGSARSPGALPRYARPHGPVAQRLEQGTHNSLVPGSNPGGPLAESTGTRRRVAIRQPLSARSHAVRCKRLNGDAELDHETPLPRWRILRGVRAFGQPEAATAVVIDSNPLRQRRLKRLL